MADSADELCRCALQLGARWGLPKKVNAQLKLVAFADYVGISSFHVEVDDNTLAGELLEYVGAVSKSGGQATVVVMFARAEAGLRQQYAKVKRPLTVGTFKVYRRVAGNIIPTTLERVVKPNNAVVTTGFALGQLSSIPVQSCKTVGFPYAGGKDGKVCRESGSGFATFEEPRAFDPSEILKLTDAMRSVAYQELVSHINENYPVLLAESPAEFRGEQADVALW